MSMFNKIKNLITDKDGGSSKYQPQIPDQKSNPPSMQQSKSQVQPDPKQRPVSSAQFQDLMAQESLDTLRHGQSMRQPTRPQPMSDPIATQQQKPANNFQQELIQQHQVDFESDEDDQDAFFSARNERQPQGTFQYSASTVVRQDQNKLAQSQRVPTNTKVMVKPLVIEPKQEPVQIPSTFPKVQPLKPQESPKVEPPTRTPIQPQLAQAPVQPQLAQAPVQLQPAQTPIQPPTPVQQRSEPSQAQEDKKVKAPARPRNHISRAMDLDLDDDEDGDDINPMDSFDSKRGRTKDGHSAALERIRQKRERGTMLPTNKRPDLTLSQDIDKKIVATNDQTVIKPPTTTEDLHTKSPPKNLTKQTVIIDAPKQSEIPERVADVDQDFLNPHFVDFAEKRAEVSRIAENRRLAVRKNVTGPFRMQQQKQEVELSSDSDLTDKKFEDNISIDSDEIETTLQKQYERSDSFIEEAPSAPEATNIVESTFDEAEDIECDEQDVLQVITSNENMFKHYGEKKLKDQRNLSMQSAKSLSKFKDNASSQSVVKEPQLLKYAKSTQETCVAICNDILLVGTQGGLVYAYNTKLEKQLGVHKEDSKDFVDNAVTAIDIHKRRPDFCVIGFQKGQIALVNINQITKTMKLIKDHHKEPVISVKFCDWSKEKPHLHRGPTHSCKECDDIKSWMFISSDSTGKVVQNTVDGMGFGMMYANSTVFIDPFKMDSLIAMYSVLAPRMSSREKPLEYELDFATMVALGSSENVVIWITPEKSRIERLTIDKPTRYPSQNMDDVMPVMSQLPILAWGFGRTPRFNYQTFPLLAIAWGPIIQLVVFKEINGVSMSDNFELDGFYIIAPEKLEGKRSPNGLDTTIQSLHFLDDSLLVAVTSSNEIRVMLTQKFKEKEFAPPAYLEDVVFDDFDSRCKMMPIGSELTEQQCEIEMERLQTLDHALVQTKFSALEASQSQSVFEDKVICLTTGGIYLMHHLNWLQSLGDTEDSVVSGAWIEIFAKALEIYTGKVKGLRMNLEDEKKDNMRDQLKVMIDKQVGQIIKQWKTRAETNFKSGTMNQIQIQEDLNSKFQTLIRIVIEFCVEIQEPVFLFDTLLKKFHGEGKSMLFAEELKPYILSGHFAECQISEVILSEQILQHHQKVYTLNYEQIQNGTSGESISAAVSPAENFEKIVINFKFDSCSRDYKLSLIEFCRKYGLTSALMYMCLNCYGESGPLQALTQLKDFYQDTLVNEAMGDSVLQREDLQALQTMPANYFDRILLERSSCYLGLKLLWSARLFLQGKKFPRGFLSTQEWHVCCHDIMDLITQEDQVQLLTEIDAEAYFQILSISFIKNSLQFKFIESGRPTVYQADTISVSHDLIVRRVSAYFKQAPTDPAHIHYLCFIASIAGSYKQEAKDERIYYEVALELLNNSDLLLQNNKDMLKERSSKYNMYKRLQCLNAQSCYIALSEQMLLMLIERARSTLLQWRPERQKMLKACEATSFQNVKLVLYELNDDYLKCLQLFIDCQNDDKMKEAVTWVGRINGFSWIKDKFEKLERLAIETNGQVQKQQLLNFQKEVLNRAVYFVKQDVSAMILLCDTVFKVVGHYDIIDKINEFPPLQLEYIKTLLKLKRKDIKEALIASGTTGIVYQKLQKRTSTEETNQWQKILALHIRLVCEQTPKLVTAEIEKVIKDGFYPMEDCLQICTEHHQTEAAALLNKKIGHYQQAIQLYLQILQREINYERLKKELYYLNKEAKRHAEKERQALFQENQARFKKKTSAIELGDLSQILIQATVKTVVQQIQVKDRRIDLYKVWVEKFGKNIDLLDRSLDKMINICKAHPKEVLLTNEESWQNILTFLFTVLFHPSLRKKSYCKRHLKLKMVEFCRCILPHVPFARIIYGASAQTSTLRFKAVKELVTDVFADKSQEFEMCQNANTTQARDLLILQGTCQQINSGGVIFTEESLFCGLCDQFINSKLVPGSQLDDYKIIFDCKKGSTCDYNHVFHHRCLKKIIGQEHTNKKAMQGLELDKFYRCPKCYPKSQDVIISYTELAKKTKKPKEDSNSDSESSQTSSQHSVEEIIQKPVVDDKDQKKLTHREKQLRRFDELMMKEQTLSRADFIL